MLSNAMVNQKIASKNSDDLPKSNDFRNGP